MVSFTLNDKRVSVDADANTPLLWVIRDHVGLTGTKYGCGAGLCGACTVHVNGQAVRSCQTKMSTLETKTVLTIDALGGANGQLHPVQRAWVTHNVPQCGYCQSGQIMSAVALLKATPNPTDADIDRGMAGNICRCGTYQRIRAAIHTAAKERA
jgi:isoquinoline 1-oxidoreductase alpha subunit